VDASEAFDRVDHKVLFQKLVNRGAPRCLVGVLRIGMVNLCHLSGGMVFLVQIFVLIVEFVRAAFSHHYTVQRRPYR